MLMFNVTCRNTVKDSILSVFSGPADKGIFSPSVQNTLHLTEKLVLDSIPEVQQLRMSYFTFVDLINFSMFSD